MSGVRGEVLEAYLETVLQNQPKARTVLFKDDLWFIRGAGGRQALIDDLKALKRVRERFPERDVTFSGKARVDTFVHPKTLEIDHELLRLTKEAGFFSLSYGIAEYLRIVAAVEAAGWSRTQLVPHAGHLFAANVVAGLGLGGHEAAPDPATVFGGFPKDWTVARGRLTLGEAPGVGFEAKANAYEVLSALVG